MFRPANKYITKYKTIMLFPWMFLKRIRVVAWSSNSKPENIDFSVFINLFRLISSATTVFCSTRFSLNYIPFWFKNKWFVAFYSYFVPRKQQTRAKSRFSSTMFPQTITYRTWFLRVSSGQIVRNQLGCKSRNRRSNLATWTIVRISTSLTLQGLNFPKFYSTEMTEEERMEKNQESWPKIEKKAWKRSKLLCADNPFLSFHYDVVL